MDRHDALSDRDALISSLATTSQDLVDVAIRSVNVAAPAVTATQHRALVLLAGGPQRTVGALASRLGVEPSGATLLCDRLEKSGFVQRQRPEDGRRAVTFQLTRGGREVLRAVHATRREELGRILADSRTGEVAELAAIMVRFADQAQHAQSSTAVSR